MTYVEVRRWCRLTTERWVAGDGAGAWAALAAAARLATEPGPLAEVESARSVLALRAEQPDGAAVAARRCLDLVAGLARPTPEQRAAADHARVSLATVGTYAPTRSDEWRAGLEELRRVARGPADPGAAARATNNALLATTAALEPGLGERDPGAVVDAWLAVGAARAAAGDASAGSVVTRQAVDLAFRTGMWERGWDHATRVEQEPSRTEQVALHAKAALLAWHRGDDAAARDHGARALRASVAVDVVWVRLYAHLGGVVAAAAGSGPLPATLRAYVRAVPRADHARRPARAWQAAQVALDAGADLAAVTDLLDATGALPLLPAPVDRLAAVVLADRHGTLTDDVLDVDLVALDAVDQARVLLARARHRSRTGRGTAAALDLARARATLRSWPGRVLDEVEAATRTTAPPRVTPAQARVLDLLVEGLSNDEVATALGVSPRTVAVHVSRLLRASGASSRTELAVRELGRRLGAAAG